MLLQLTLAHRMFDCCDGYDMDVQFATSSVLIQTVMRPKQRASPRKLLFLQNFMTLAISFSF